MEWQSVNAMKSLARLRMESPEHEKVHGGALIVMSRSGTQASSIVYFLVP